MFNIELIFVDRVEVFQWPDRKQAELLASYYGDSYKGDKRFVACRVREATTSTPVLDSIRNLFDN